MNLRLGRFYGNRQPGFGPYSLQPGALPSPFLVRLSCRGPPVRWPTSAPPRHSDEQKSRLHKTSGAIREFSLRIISHASRSLSIKLYPASVRMTLEQPLASGLASPARSSLATDSLDSTRLRATVSLASSVKLTGPR